MTVTIKKFLKLKLGDFARKLFFEKYSVFVFDIEIEKENLLSDFLKEELIHDLKICGSVIVFNVSVKQSKLYLMVKTVEDALAMKNILWLLQFRLISVKKTRKIVSEAVLREELIKRVFSTINRKKNKINVYFTQDEDYNPLIDYLLNYDYKNLIFVEFFTQSSWVKRYFKVNGFHREKLLLNMIRVDFSKNDLFISGDSVYRKIQNSRSEYISTFQNYKMIFFSKLSILREEESISFFGFEEILFDDEYITGLKNIAIVDLYQYIDINHKINL